MKMVNLELLAVSYFDLTLVHCGKHKEECRNISNYPTHVMVFEGIAFRPQYTT